MAANLWIVLQTWNEWNPSSAAHNMSLIMEKILEEVDNKVSEEARRSALEIDKIGINPHIDLSVVDSFVSFNPIRIKKFPVRQNAVGQTEKDRVC